MFEAPAKRDPKQKNNLVSIQDHWLVQSKERKIISFFDQGR